MSNKIANLTLEFIMVDIAETIFDMQLSKIKLLDQATNKHSTVIEYL